MKTTRTRKNMCPACGYCVDAASSVDSEATPKDGDVSICAGCGSFLVFHDSLKLRLITVQEIAELEPEQRTTMIKIRCAINNR